MMQVSLLVNGSCVCVCVCVCEQLMRTITSQICALWNLSEVKLSDLSATPMALDVNNLQESMFTHSWRPWEHIYALTKPQGKSTINYPQYNSYGKYIVKLFFLVRFIFFVQFICTAFHNLNKDTSVVYILRRRLLM